MTAIVDLRSDTVTRPSAGMRRAMMEAEVGDDVFGDDPTVNRLQERAAELFGFETALLFPSGTQSNLAALMCHCQRGDEVILGAEAHTYRYEAGGAAVLGGVQPQTLPNRPDGTLDLAAVDAVIKPDDPHFARTRLLALENTISRGGRCRASIWRKRSSSQEGAASPRTSTAHASSTPRPISRPPFANCVPASTRCRPVFPRDWGPRPARFFSERGLSSTRPDARERFSEARCDRPAS
jgi:hypothetical protein